MEQNYLEHRNIVVGTHDKGKCAGQFCTIHNRSLHHMRDFPQEFRWDRGIMERVCHHGVGHPDPDEINPDTTHGCDGCCIDKSKPKVAYVSFDTNAPRNIVMKELDECDCGWKEKGLAVHVHKKEPKRKSMALRMFVEWLKALGGMVAMIGTVLGLTVYLGWVIKSIDNPLIALSAFMAPFMLPLSIGIAYIHAHDDE